MTIELCLLYEALFNANFSLNNEFHLEDALFKQHVISPIDVYVYGNYLKLKYLLDPGRGPGWLNELGCWI